MDINISATIVTVNSDADPSTGYTWAMGFAEEIKNTVLVTRIGNGHTSFFLNGDTARVIAKYFVSGKALEDGLVLQS